MLLMPFSLQAIQMMVSEHSNKIIPASNTLPLQTVPDPLAHRCMFMISGLALKVVTFVGEKK